MSRWNLCLLFALICLTSQSVSGQVAGEYSGRYRCRNGWTPVEVTIVDSGNGRLTGTFSFTPQNTRRVLTATYNLRGLYNPSARIVRMSPGAWIGTPAPGYLAVGFQANFDPDLGVLLGRILYGGCDDIELTRQGGQQGVGSSPVEIARFKEELLKALSTN